MDRITDRHRWTTGGDVGRWTSARTLPAQSAVARAGRTTPGCETASTVWRSPVRGARLAGTARRRRRRPTTTRPGSAMSEYRRGRGSRYAPSRDSKRYTVLRRSEEHTSDHTTRGHLVVILSHVYSI